MTSWRNLTAGSPTLRPNRANDLRRLASLVGVIAAAQFTVGVIAQSRPTFTGKWTAFSADPRVAMTDPGGRGRRGQAGIVSNWGQPLSITQDATTLTVEYPGAGADAAAEKFVVRLDGAESRNTSRGIDSTSRAAWEGARLVITTGTPFKTQSGQAMEVETRRELSLDASGSLVVITTSASGGFARSALPSLHRSAAAMDAMQFAVPPDLLDALRI